MISPMSGRPSVFSEAPINVTSASSQACVSPLWLTKLHGMQLLLRRLPTRNAVSPTSPWDTSADNCAAMRSRLMSVNLNCKPIRRRSRREMFPSNRPRPATYNTVREPGAIEHVDLIPAPAGDKSKTKHSSSLWRSGKKIAPFIPNCDRSHERLFFLGSNTGFWAR